MTMLKRLLSQPWAQEAVAFLLLLYVELARRSIRWEVRGDEFVRQAWDEKLPLIGCVWHGRVLMTLQGWKRERERMVALASRSREGEIGARWARWYKVGVVRGSTRNPDKPGAKGGEAAYRAMINHLSAGGCGAVTPDGPRGPRMRAGYGAVRMARETEAIKHCNDALSPLRIRKSNHCHFKNAWNFQDAPLDLKGVHIHSARNDQLFAATDD